MAESVGHVRHTDHCSECSFYAVTFRALGNDEFVRQSRCARADCDFLVGMPVVPAAYGAKSYPVPLPVRDAPVPLPVRDAPEYPFSPE